MNIHISRGTMRTLFFVITLLVLTFVAGCSVKNQGWWGGADYVYDMGNLPSDICYVNGVAQVYSHSTESNGGVSLMYLTNNGDIVMQHWMPGIANLGIKDAGKMILHGSKCPSGQ